MLRNFASIRPFACHSMHTFRSMSSSALPLRRSASTILAFLLASMLTGCNPNESDTQDTVSLKSAPGQTKAPVDISKNAHETPVPLPEPVTQASPPQVSASTIKLVIELNRATDSIDIDALQSGNELPVLPLQLSVDLSQAPLRAVLRELARKLGAKVSIADSVPDQLISLQFNGVDIAEGIKQLLRDTNYLLIYKEPPTRSNPNQGAGMEIAEIRILPKSSTEELSNETASLKVLEPIDQTAEIAEWKKQALTAEKPEDRLMALKQFLEHADPAEHNAVLIAALEDKAPEVRMLALNSMGDSANPSLEPISQAALNDESPQIRTAALDVLISRYGQEAIPVLEQALADPDATVQQTARNSLEMAQRVKNQIDAMRHRQSK
jgi:hypothetical protein